MDYVNTYLVAYIQYYVSDKVLHVDIDAAYLVDPKAQYQIAGYCHLSNHPMATKYPRLNGECFG